MQIRNILRILGILTAGFSLTLLPPVAVSFIYGDGSHFAFLAALLIVLAIGGACWLPVRNCRAALRLRDGFIIVVLIWSVLSGMAAIPFLLADNPAMTLVEALFESTSGLTTTGATVLTAIDGLPHSILFYRQQLQWLGGMGIIVLAVAVMPALGVGGMQLYRAETPGPMKDQKLTPRITETAKAIWFIYLGLTVLCAAAYGMAGMAAFDAVSHAFSTVAIGGFSTHSASLGHFDDTAIYLIASLFMLLAGLNFALHFTAFRYRRAAAYIADPEARAYLGILAAAALLTIIMLHSAGVFASLTDLSLIHI